MKRIIYCESCNAEFTINFKSEEEPSYCVFCGEEFDPDWNSSEESED